MATTGTCPICGADRPCGGFAANLEGYLDLIERERDSRPSEAMLADEIKRLRRGIQAVTEVGEVDDAESANTLMQQGWRLLSVQQDPHAVPRYVLGRSD